MHFDISSTYGKCQGIKFYPMSQLQVTGKKGEKNMYQSFKKVLCVFMVCVLALGVMPTMAFYDDETSDAPLIGFSATVGNFTTPMVSAGVNHTVALRSDGTVWAWGRNDCGQLGDGTFIDRYMPVQVQNLNNIIAISSNGTYSVALRSDGTVWAWGDRHHGIFSHLIPISNVPIQVPNLNNITAISTGCYHTVALRSDGTVWSWGNNTYGQLGDGTTAYQDTPVQAQGLNDVTAISAGGWHTLALRADGTVWSWGWNPYGQLGNGTTIDRNTPVQVQNLDSIIAISAAAGDYTAPVGNGHSVALRSDGTVWTWGWNCSGQLGDSTTTNRHTPVQVQNLSNVTAISAGFVHTVALRVDGSVWAFGDNFHGQLGDGTTINRRTPIQIQTLNNIESIATGAMHTLAVGNNGYVWAWGDNSNEQLGDGTATERHAPVQVMGAGGIGDFNLNTVTLTPTPTPTPTPPQNPQWVSWFNRTQHQAPHIYNHELATLAAELSNLAYTRTSLHNRFIELGMENIIPYTVTAPPFNNDLLDFDIASRQIELANGSHTLVFVVVRGTPILNLTQWIDNTRVSSASGDNAHGGFRQAQIHVLNNLNEYLRIHSIPCPTTFEGNRTLILFTGHSRGGAVANLMAADSIDRQLRFSRNNVYAYTFAAPNVIRFAVTGDSIYNSIFNIINRNDAFPLVPRSPLPPNQWRRFGVDMPIIMPGINSHASALYRDWMVSNPGLSYSAFRDLDRRQQRLSPIVLGFKCPVDITVYDNSGNIVAAIINGVPVNFDDSSAFAFAMDGIKYVFLPDGTYSVEIVATDNGTMTFSIDIFDVDTGEIIERNEFGNVPLQTGMEFISEISETATPSDVRLFVMENGEIINEIEGVVTIFSATEHVITVSSTTGGMATANQTSAVQGAQVALTAFPNSGNRFVRWEVVNGGIALQTTTLSAITFTMPNNAVAVRAVFEATATGSNVGGGNITPSSGGGILQTPRMTNNAATVTETEATQEPITPAATSTLRFAIGSASFTNNGISVTSDVAPFIDPATNRTMIPLRAIAEGLGAIVDWDDATRTVHIFRNGEMVSLTIDMPLPDGMGTAIILNGRTFVPLRYVSEILGAEVHWDEANQAVYIYQ
jgi:alpha-tubulin suppressor-like RCC1 family protein